MLFENKNISECDNQEYITWLEELYKQTRRYVSKEFAKHMKSAWSKKNWPQTQQLAWEMYLAKTLLDNDFVLEEKSKNNGGAPDLCIIYEDKKIHIECCMPGLGGEAPGGKDNHSDIVDMTVYDLRITSIIEAKNEQYKEWVEKKVCQEV